MKHNVHIIYKIIIGKINVKINPPYGYTTVKIVIWGVNWFKLSKLIFAYRAYLVWNKQLKWLVTQKLNFFVGFPPSVQDFFVFEYGNLDLRFRNLSPFCIFSIDLEKILSKRRQIVKF